MGTNYYLCTNYCDSCERFDKQHLGKQSFGWPFMFSDWAFVEDWKVLAKEESNSIIDEYGTYIGYEDFWKMAEENKDKKLHIDLGDEKHFFQDKDGYWYMKGKFS